MIDKCNITLLVLVTLSIPSLVISQETIKTKLESISVPSIKGKATVQLKIKKTPDTLKDIEIALCPASTASEIKAARERGWLRLAHPKRYNDGYENLDLVSIGTAAVKTAVARTKANDEGFYAFYDIDPGEYILYAQYKSKFASGYWVLPVTVEEGMTVDQDFNTENFKEVYNKTFE
ncbi:MAG: carboxypeptidase-like regulatory domain-containing protein [Verrucomicrobiota bacterium]